MVGTGSTLRYSEHAQYLGFLAMCHQDMVCYAPTRHVPLIYVQVGCHSYNNIVGLYDVLFLLLLASG